MKKTILCFSTLLFGLLATAQKYEFQPIQEISCLPVISQDKTGTCWSFSTSSFFEAEIYRITGKKIDISEMYSVRNTYPKKAFNYVYRQGKAQFGEGALAHDVLNSIQEFGLVPQSVYSGKTNPDEKYNHAEMVAVLENMLKTYANSKEKLSANWKNAINSVLDSYMGKAPVEFEYEGKKYTPKSFLTATKLNPHQYITLTSFTHVPFYNSFVLDIPDNFSNEKFYNVPLDEYIQNIDNALAKGYTLALDSDVSEDTFSGKNGIAVIPKNDEDKKTILTEIKPEKEISQQFRQEEFENFNTVDDHLMHIVGKMKDQNGTIYYKVKNSWGTVSGKEGYIYMSVPYIRLKSISVLMHKDGLMKTTQNKLSL